VADDVFAPCERYRNLRRNIILIIIGVALTPMLLIHGIFLEKFYRSYQNKAQAHLQELARRHSSRIDDFIDERRRNLLYLVHSVDLTELCDATRLQRRLRMMQAAYANAFEDLGVIDSRGKQMAYAGPYALSGADYASAPWFKEAMQRQAYISDVFLGLRQRPHFIIAVRTRGSGKAWFIRATIDFEAFNRLVANLRIGRSGGAFIINRQGALQTQRPAADPGDPQAYLQLFADVMAGKASAQAIEATDRNGVPGLVAASLLKNGEWLFICRQERADAYAELYRAQKAAVVIFVLGSLAVVVMAFILAQLIARRLEGAYRMKPVTGNQQLPAD
jgi:two-component system NtrC family sensor kinase